jgi:glycosyltransferase involved in cell wall biosynthesis
MSVSVLSQRPFTAEFRQRLERSLGRVPTYISMWELRTLPLPRIWKHLRSIKADRLLIPLEDENARAVLPFLKIIAGISSARQIEVLDSQQKPVLSGRAGLIRDVLAIGHATVASRVAALAASREMSALMKLPRIPAIHRTSKRVLYVNANLWFGVKAGGSVGHIAGIINTLSRLGYDLTYAAVCPNPSIAPQVKCHLLQPPASFGFPLEYTQYLFDKSATKQISAICPANLGFIYQRMSLANFTGVKLSRRLGVPSVVEYNGSEVWAAKNWSRPLTNDGLANRAEDVVLRHAHVVATVSETLKQELISRGVEEKRVAVYPNCIDETLYDPARFSPADRQEIRAKYGISPDAIVIGFIGTFGQWHGVEVLAQAIRKLFEEQRQWVRERRVHFLLIGDGFAMPVVQKTLQVCPSGPFWTLTGLIPQSDGAAYLASTDILVAPHVPNPDGTRFFGSPTKLFEYMAMGKAIIASDLDQIGDVLRNGLQAGSLPQGPPGETRGALGVVCRPGDIDDLIKGMQFAVDQPEWRLLLGRNARVEALAKYTWRMHVENILSTLTAVQE